ncbi:MAG TPA: RDD family protein [Thermoanaerobaculia bacterium]|nr:RDD family protein [Thermoanaerobaculia bacterium]
MICQNHVDVAEGVRRCSRCGTPYCNDCLVEIQGYPYCATCKTEQLLDVRSGVDATVLDYASISRRFGASFVDGLITGVPALIVIFSVVGMQSAAGSSGFMGGWFLLPSLIAMVYEALMLKAKGQTLGKMALKVKVVAPDGRALSTGQAWGRAVGRVLLGFLYIVDYIPAFFTKEKTTLHDMFAKTRVVNAM